jgi:hypothetical protein
MLRYEARPKADGDYEVWRHIPGSETSEEHVATFHNFLRDISTVNVAEINAAHFVKEQNERERLLDEGVKLLHQLS